VRERFVGNIETTGFSFDRDRVVQAVERVEAELEAENVEAILLVVSLKSAKEDVQGGRPGHLVFAHGSNDELTEALLCLNDLMIEAQPQLSKIVRRASKEH
jgi:hypothetical protein